MWLVLGSSQFVLLFKNFFEFLSYRGQFLDVGRPLLAVEFLEDPNDSLEFLDLFLQPFLFQASLLLGGTRLSAGTIRLVLHHINKSSLAVVEANRFTFVTPQIVFATTEEYAPLVAIKIRIVFVKLDASIVV